MQHDFPKPMYSGCIHTSKIKDATSNQGSLLIQSNALHLLKNQSKFNSSLPWWLLNTHNKKEEK